MSQNDPITINSWTLGDQCAFEERIAAANAAGFEARPPGGDLCGRLERGGSLIKIFWIFWASTA